MIRHKLPSRIANAITGEQFAMNDLQPMTAGSTYKLPLNMLVVDEVAKGKLNLTDRFDITNTYYEYVGSMTITLLPLMEPCLSLICSAIHWFTLKIPQPMLWQIV